MIGLDISDQTIKIAQLSDGKVRRLLAKCIYTIPAGVIENGVVINKKAMQEAVGKALSSCRINSSKKDTVVVSIPETQSFLRVIELPNMSDDEVEEAIRFEIAQHIPFSVDSVYIDWQALGDSGHKVAEGKREVQVGAAQKKVVDPLYEVIMDIGLDVAAFELESQAIVRALISPELYGKQGVIIVDVGSTSTNVIVHDVGASRFTASLQQGVKNLAAGLSAQDREQLMQNLQNIPADLLERVTPQLEPGLDKLVLDIKGVVDFYNSIDANHRVREIIMTGGGSNLTGLDMAFLHHFEDIHVERGNPWVNILSAKERSHTPLNIQESVRYATALGLALRTVVSL